MQEIQIFDLKWEKYRNLFSKYWQVSKQQGGNSQNFLRKFVIFFVTLSCFYKVIIH